MPNVSAVAAFDAATSVARLITISGSLGRCILASVALPACRLLPSGGNHPPHAPLAGCPNDGVRSVRVLSPRFDPPAERAAPTVGAHARGIQRSACMRSASFPLPSARRHATHYAARTFAVRRICLVSYRGRAYAACTADPNGGERNPKRF